MHAAPVVQPMRGHLPPACCHDMRVVAARPCSPHPWIAAHPTIELQSLRHSAVQASDRRSTLRAPLPPCPPPHICPTLHGDPPPPYLPPASSHGTPPPATGHPLPTHRLSTGLCRPATWRTDWNLSCRLSCRTLQGALTHARTCTCACTRALARARALAYVHAHACACTCTHAHTRARTCALTCRTSTTTTTTGPMARCTSSHTHARTRTHAHTLAL